MPAGDQGDAVGATRQQRADGRGVAGVVEDDEQAAPVGQGTEQRGRGRRRFGHASRRHTERRQELTEDFDEGGFSGVAETAQIGEEPPVGEKAGVAVGPLQSQRGLAHPGQPGDQTDGCLGGGGPGERGQFGLAPLESPGRPRQQIGGVRQADRRREANGP